MVGKLKVRGKRVDQLASPLVFARRTAELETLEESFGKLTTTRLRARPLVHALPLPLRKTLGHHTTKREPGVMWESALDLVASELWKTEAVAADVFQKDFVLQTGELVLVATLTIALLELAEAGNNVVAALLWRSSDLPLYIHLSSSSGVLFCILSFHVFFKSVLDFMHNNICA